MKKPFILLLCACALVAAQAGPKHIRTSDGVDLYVQVKGKGTPCLYIHGGPGSGSWWLEKFSGKMLAERFQMIYLDQRGVARSTSPKDGNYSMDRMVKDFEEVRTALHIERWITLGHSFGGVLQMGYAQRHPEVNKGMIMLNCSLSMNVSLTDGLATQCELLNDDSLCADKQSPALDRWMTMAGKLRKKDIFWKLQYGSKKNKEIMDATFDEVPNWNHDFENVAMTIKDYSEDFTKAAPTMKMPVLFFFGRTDWAVGPTHYKHVHFPNRLLWGSDVGHVPFLENPADLEKAITAFQKKYGL